MACSSFSIISFFVSYCFRFLQYSSFTTPRPAEGNSAPWRGLFVNNLSHVTTMETRSQSELQSMMSRMDELDRKTDLILEILRQMQEDLQAQKRPLTIMEGHVHNVEHCMQNNLMVRKFRFLWHGWQHSFPRNLTFQRGAFNGVVQNPIKLFLK